MRTRKKIETPCWEGNGELSLMERKSISDILKQSGISLKEETLDEMFEAIGDALRETVKRIEDEFEDPVLNSQANARGEIMKLLCALRSLSYSSHLILEEAATFTQMHEHIASRGIAKDLYEWRPTADFISRLENHELYHYVIENLNLGRLATNALEEACKIALSDANIVDRYTSKSGRPPNVQYHILCQDLAEVFKAFTGKEPTSSPSGAFDDFLSACLKIIEPNRGAEDNRKLIETSLPKYQKTRCPKPIKNREG